VWSTRLTRAEESCRVAGNGGAATPGGIDMWKALVRDEGQDLLEYGLLASLIATFVIGALTMVGNQINDVLWGMITRGLRF
jgi:Flp pilus assembly pilin Flp